MSKSKKIEGRVCVWFTEVFTSHFVYENFHRFNFVEFYNSKVLSVNFV